MKVVTKPAGQRIRETRERKGISREQLANKIGVTAGYLGPMENGKAHLSEALAEKICKKLGMRLTAAEIDAQNRRLKRWLDSDKSEKPAKGSKAKSEPTKTSKPVAMAAPRKVKPAKQVPGQYQLPGIAEMIGAELKLQVQDMVRAALQRGLTAQSEAVEPEAEETLTVVPRWDKAE